MNIYLTHRNWDAASKEDEKYNLVGWSFGYAAYSLTGSLAKSSETTIATQKENTQTYLEIGINYQICEKSKLAVTFAQRKDDDGVLDTDADVHKMNQTALGYIYQFSPHVRMHAYVYQFKYREQDSSLAQANDNTAWVGAAGGIVSF
ncbi:MAG: porin [Bdellovibrionales bacterium]|nr:porin [Bdellovibrionales bacterium]